MIPRTRPPHLAAVLLALGACSSGHGDPSSPDAGPGEDDAAAQDPVVWEQHDAPAGAALWIDAQPAGDALEVTVSGRELGEVFGLSVHLSWDPRVLTVDTAAVDQVAFLDPEADGRALMVAASPAPGDLALGGSRTSREAGTITLDGETVLARLPVAITGSGRSRIELTRAAVARQDGTLSPVAVAGGELVVAEVTP